MPCFQPLKGWHSVTPNSSGKFPITFNRKNAYTDRPVTLPCGQCIGCRLERLRQWAIRCVHEASLHDDNAFITLTYNDQHLPADRSLDIRTFQLFMKRLRKKINPLKIRFYACGEYGETYGRPHYHAIIFGYGFPDKTRWKETNGETLYRSKLLEKAWTDPDTNKSLGYSSIGTVTFSSAAYVARYILKKINGKNADAHYECIHPETGEITQLKPEYTNMSRRPGIGSRWFDQYKTDVYPEDFIIINNKKMRPPKFYDARFELFSPEEFKKIKSKRIRGAKLNHADQTPARLAVQETVQNSKLKQLPRNLE